MKQIQIKQLFTNVDESLHRYFVDIRRIPLLTEEEEQEYAKQLPDESAKQKLITSNLRFVISIAKQYQGQGLSLMELISLGNMGLVKSVDYYNPKFKVRFLSYAGWWIRQSIVLGLTEDTKLVAVPNVVRATYTKIKKLTEKYMKKEGREPSKQEILDHLHLTESEYSRATLTSTRYSSVDSPVNGDENDDRILLDILPNTEELVTDKMDLIDTKSDLNKLIAQLPWNEYMVIKYTFGFSCKIKPIREIAAELEITPERVRQLKNKALETLKKEISRNGL